MRRVISLAEAARAAEELASALLGFNVAKAIDPLTEAGFLLITELVSTKLATAAAGAEALVVREVLEELALDWGTMSAEAVSAALKAINKTISESYAKRVLPKVADIFQIEGPKMMTNTRLAVIARERIRITPSLSQRDLAAEEAIRKTHLNFIRDSSGVRAEALSAKARELVASRVAQGLSTAQIGKDLEAALSEDIPRPSSYWKVVADAFVGRGRTESQISSYEEAGIEAYEIVAVIDEVTTDICRFMDGQVFHVSAARGLLDQLSKLDDPEQVRYMNPWVRKGADPDGGMRLYVPNADGSTTTIAKIDRSGVGARDDRGEFSSARSTSELASLGIPVPPFHGRCRSTIVAAAE
jgi:SPP1 gp7 family putative phage head morphogenesis protein